jgi:hypothetical protein
LSWYSLYGTGATIHGIERRGDGRVEFTSWISVFWIPIVPLRSWSALYAGERPPDGLTDEAHCFADVQRVSHNWARNGRTLATGLAVAICAGAPTLIMAARTNGRAATGAEMVVVFASAAWALGLILWSERHRRRRLRGI